MDQQTHKRYLDYRQRHEYFGRQKAILTLAEFEPLDVEARELEAKGRTRDDEEETRLYDLYVILLRD